ncbi:hypothetical protein EON63_23590 [archaeon]|nr:MAG: hypothetical protein EON63_23590 [archaeon]
MQSVLYIRVKQQATIELQEFIFTHVHHLSLTFHLNKSTGMCMDMCRPMCMCMDVVVVCIELVLCK